jgi:anti-sigma B factor antagonist
VPEIRYLCKMNGGVLVVTAPPEIDVTTADHLRAVLLDAAAGGHATVVVDLTLTRFCDSCGLHTLLRAHKLARADGGELRLVIPADGPVPRIFALMRLDSLIPCFASLKEALTQGVMSGPDARDRAEYFQQEAARLKQQVAELASSVAVTEDRVADTLEKVAEHRPAADAERLRAQAESARQFAASERDLANQLSNDRG